MKKIHYQNIGFPKTGTSWLHGRLGTMYKVTQLVKENPAQEKYINDEQFETEYLDLYREYDITYNLNTQTYNLSIDKIKKIHEYTTHLSIILRNPWELMESWYNYTVMPDLNDLEYIDTLDTNLMFNFPEVYRKWTNSQIPLKIMFYDDLCVNPVKFIKEICEYTEIGYLAAKSHGSILSWYEYVNVTQYFYKLPTPSMELIDLINERINQTEIITGRNLSHWKNNAKKIK